MNWAGEPTLMFADGDILPKKVELILYPEYYPDNCTWPVDPQTGRELAVADKSRGEDNTIFHSRGERCSRAFIKPKGFCQRIYLFLRGYRPFWMGGNWSKTNE